MEKSKTVEEYMFNLLDSFSEKAKKYQGVRCGLLIAASLWAFFWLLSIGVDKAVIFYVTVVAVFGALMVHSPEYKINRFIIRVLEFIWGFLCILVFALPTWSTFANIFFCGAFFLFGLTSQDNGSEG